MSQGAAMGTCTWVAPLILVLITSVPIGYCDITFTDVGTFLVQHAGIVGVQVPSYLKVITYQRSSILTRFLHFIFGGSLETYFNYVLKKVTMPKSSKIPPLQNEKQGAYLKDGEVRGLNSFKMKEGSQIEIAFDKGLPSAIVSSNFTDMTIFYRYKIDMGMSIIKTGEATSKVAANTLMVKFRPTINMKEWCFVKLYGIEFSEFGGLHFEVKSTDAFSISGGAITGTFMETFFQTAGSALQDIIENVIAKHLFYEIPKQSDHICDNPEGSYVEKKKT